MSEDPGEYKTDPMTVMCEFMESDEFKEAFFDPDDVSLQDLSHAVTETDVSEKLGGDFLTEFHMGYKYFFYLGIPGDAYRHQLGIEEYGRQELLERMEDIERQRE